MKMSSPKELVQKALENNKNDQTIGGLLKWAENGDTKDLQEFDIEKYITHRFSIDDFDAAYKKACDGSGLKVCIEFYKG